jgi:ribosome-binding factor A
MKNNTVSHRVQRVESLIGEALIDVLRRGKQLDPLLINCPVSITKIEVTKDLKIAKCYFLPFNTKLTVDQLLTALENSKFAIRDFVTKKINLKYSTEIRFYFDQGFDNANIVDQYLKKNKLSD